MQTFGPAGHTRVVRHPERAAYDRDPIYQILDEGFVCHMGYAVDGQPYVIPTMYARVGEVLYVHGSAASRTLRHLNAGVAVCVTVTLVDGLVLAYSVYDHSMNYRSVVAFGTATLVQGVTEKREALRAFTEKVLPGRWAVVRQPTEQELKATAILSLPLTEVSAKVRTGPVKGSAEDYRWPVWAGVIPLRLVAETPIRDEQCDSAFPAPQFR